MKLNACFPFNEVWYLLTEKSSSIKSRIKC